MRRLTATATLTILASLGWSAPASATRSVSDSITADTDGDGVWDTQDLCPGSDDTVDIDIDGIADCDQNLLEGPMFDDATDASAWAGDFVFDAGIDAQGFAGSGSLNLDYDAIAGHATSRCVVASGSTDYVYMLEMDFVKEGYPAAYLFVLEYTDSSCGWNSGQTLTHQQTSSTSGWAVVDGSFTTAASTRAVKVVVVNNRVGSSNWPLMQVDNILLHERAEDLGDDGEPGRD